EVAYNSYASQIFLAGTESTTGYGDFWVYRNSVNSGSGYAVRVAGPQAGAFIIEQNVIEYTGASWSQTTGSGYTFTDRNNKVGSNVLESDHTQTGTPDYTVGHIIQAAA